MSAPLHSITEVEAALPDEGGMTCEELAASLGAKHANVRATLEYLRGLRRARYGFRAFGTADCVVTWSRVRP